MSEAVPSKYNGQLISGVLSEGVDIINENNIEVFTKELFYTGTDVFKNVVTDVAEDEKLRRDMTREIVKLSNKGLRSMDEMSQKELDALINQQDTYLDLLKTDPDTEHFIIYVTEIRSIRDQMWKIHKNSLDSYMEMLESTKNQAESASDSSIWRNYVRPVLIGAGVGAAVGYGAYKYNTHKKIGYK